MRLEKSFRRPGRGAKMEYSKTLKNRQGKFVHFKHDINDRAWIVILNRTWIYTNNRKATIILGHDSAVIASFIS